MKIKHDFITNSSSSSFIVQKDALTEDQINLLLDYEYSSDNHDGWRIYSRDNIIKGFTVMDNDELDQFLRINNFDLSKFIWSD